jgi:hypothetical protein
MKGVLMYETFPNGVTRDNYVPAGTTVNLNYPLFAALGQTLLDTSVSRTATVGSNGIVNLGTIPNIPSVDISVNGIDLDGDGVADIALTNTVIPVSIIGGLNTFSIYLTSISSFTLNDNIDQIENANANYTIPNNPTFVITANQAIATNLFTYNFGASNIVSSSQLWLYYYDEYTNKHFVNLTGDISFSADLKTVSITPGTLLSGAKYDFYAQFVSADSMTTTNVTRNSIYVTGTYATNYPVASTGFTLVKTNAGTVDWNTTGIVNNLSWNNPSVGVSGWKVYGKSILGTNTNWVSLTNFQIYKSYYQSDYIYTNSVSWNNDFNVYPDYSTPTPFVNTNIVTLALVPYYTSNGISIELPQSMAQSVALQDTKSPTVSSGSYTGSPSSTWYGYLQGTVNGTGNNSVSAWDTGAFTNTNYYTVVFDEFIDPLSITTNVTLSYWAAPTYPATVQVSMNSNDYLTLNYAVIVPAFSHVSNIAFNFAGLKDSSGNVLTDYNGSGKGYTIYTNNAITTTYLTNAPYMLIPGNFAVIMSNNLGSSIKRTTAQVWGTVATPMWSNNILTQTTNFLYVQFNEPLYAASVASGNIAISFAYATAPASNASVLSLVPDTISNNQVDISILIGQGTIVSNLIIDFGGLKDYLGNAAFNNGAPAVTATLQPYTNTVFGF